MKISFFLIAVIGLLFLVGCKASVQAPSNLTNTSIVVQQPLVNNSPTNETNNSQVSKETPKETINDVYTSSLTENGTINESMINRTLNKEAYNISEGTHIVEIRKTLDSMVFFPLNLNIKIGETVRWINVLEYMDRQADISIYSYSTGVLKSPDLKYGEYYDHTFTESGNFTYNAVPYQARFKRGTIVVTE